LHAQRLFWKLEGRDAICWAFHVINDNKLVDGKIPQVMKYHLCSKTLMLYNFKTKLRKGLISYYKINGTSTLKKQVDVEHILLAKKLGEQVNNLMRTQVEKNQLKRGKMYFHIKFLKIFLQNFLTRRMKCKNNNFLNI
jgi:hypothetical protein